MYPSVCQTLFSPDLLDRKYDTKIVINILKVNFGIENISKFESTFIEKYKIPLIDLPKNIFA